MTSHRFLSTAAKTSWVLLAVAFGMACSDDGSSSQGGSGGSAVSTGGSTGGSVPTGGVGNSGGVMASGGVTESGGQPAAGGSAETGGESGTGGSASAVPLFTELPELLSETGLYADIAADVVNPGVKRFDPQFWLWTDTADKRRWMYLPEGTQIDTSDMDNWTYPVGTIMWKEFVRDGVRIETRVLARVKEGGRGWKGAAYIWNEDNTEAVISHEGEENVKGTDHDVPSEEYCLDCHGDRPDWPLGFGAIQLSYDSDLLDIDDLMAENLLSNPPAEPLVIPGTEEEKALLGYLHSNCGSCHRTEASGAERSVLLLWLTVDKLGSFQETDAYTNMVNQPVDFIESEEEYRIFGGAPEKSEVYRRMVLRGDKAQMPQVGTEMADPTGVEMMENWINSLPPPEGTP